MENESGKIVKYFLENLQRKQKKEEQNRDVVLTLVTIILIFTMIMLFFGTKVEAKSIDCNKHKIYCKIVELKPNINKTTAMNLSNIFYKYSTKYNQDAILSVAIAMQETRIRNISRKQDIIVFDNNSYKVITGYTDICMFQFHVNTIQYYKLDPIKLKTNQNYCIEQHFKLMSIKRKKCNNLGNDSWTCYHSKNRKLGKFYKSLVVEYL